MIGVRRCSREASDDAPARLVAFARRHRAERRAALRRSRSRGRQVGPAALVADRRDLRGCLRVLRRARVRGAQASRADRIRGRRGRDGAHVGACRQQGGGALIDDRPRYMISVAAELVGMHPQTLRIYENKGLVSPKRTRGNTRLYSEADLERLRLIQRLTTELGLNLAGVDTVLRLEDELDRLRSRTERLERQMRGKLRAVHRQYKRESGLYTDRASQSRPE